MTEERWHELAGDLAIVAAHIQDLETIDELAGFATLWDAILAPALRNIPEEIWERAHQVRMAYQQGTHTLQETEH